MTGENQAAASDEALGISWAEFPKRVFIDESPHLGNLYTGTMSILRDRFQTSFVVLCTGGDRGSYFKNHCRPDAGDSAVHLEELYENSILAADNINEAEVIKEAQRNESDYSVNYLRDIIMADRRHATAFNPNAQQSVHTTHAKTDMVKIYAQINFFFSFFTKTFEKEKIELLVIRPDSLMGGAATYAAVKRGIPVTFASAANYKSFATWLCGPYMHGGYLEQAIQKRKLGPVQSSVDGGTEELVPTMAKKIIEDVAPQLPKVSYLLKNLWLITKIRIAFIIEDIKNRKRAKRLSYMTVFRQHFRIFQAARYLKKNSYQDIGDICEQPFILFFLQVEPEYSTLCLAREFNHTEAILYQLAVSLPVGYRLVVKEHAPNIGNRDINFYRRLRRIPNLILADYEIAGHKLLGKCKAISTVSGSVGKESTRIGKPAIIFAGHVDYLTAPNVRHVGSFYDLDSILKWATADISESTIKAWKESGNLLYDALYDISFDAPGVRMFRGDGTPMEFDQLEKSAEVLVGVWKWQKEHGVPIDPYRGDRAS